MHRIAFVRGAVSRTCTRAVASVCLFLFSFALCAHAVTVRGTVRDPLRTPVAGARVDLLRDGRVVAYVLSDQSGRFEIAVNDGGQFALRATAVGLSVAPANDVFYAGLRDVVERDVLLRVSAVSESVTVTATGVPLPGEQAAASVSVVPDAALATRVGVVGELRLQPGVALVQTGQYGGVASLFVRGGSSDSNKVLIDDVPANDVGGVFDFGTVSSTAVRALETRRDPASVVYGTDARAGAVRFETPRAKGRPALNYSGDAGNLHTWRNEVEGSAAYGRVDGYAAFSRFDSSNALPNDRFHAATSAANVGYSVSDATSLRGTVRNSVSAVGLPGPYDFQGLTQVGKQGDQDTYVSAVIDNILLHRWHNSARYIGARKREQSQQFKSAGTPDGFGDYIGNAVTIHGANGTSGTGKVFVGYDPFPTRYDLVSNRDGLDYRSEFVVTEHLRVLGGLRFQDEGGAYRYPVFGTNQQVGRTNYDTTFEVQGDVKQRVFFTLGGAVQSNSLYGTQAQPQVGVAAWAVRPAEGWFRGTKVSFHFSKGVQEPSLSTELTSLYAQLVAAKNTAAIAAFDVGPIRSQRSRTYEGGVEQRVYGDRAVLKLTYFHNEFGDGIEYVSRSLYNSTFRQTLPTLLFGFYLNSLNYHAQGVEAELQSAVTRHVFARAGYTYLNPIVDRSFATDALQAQGGTPTVNLKYPGVAIGVSSPLVGQRPFRRPPQTGYFAVTYSRARWTAAVTGAMQSKSDDSTFIGTFSNAAFNTSLLLPNRNLDYGFAKIDASAMYQARPWLAVFSQAENLLNDQHMGPIGYPSLPLTVRVGVKLRAARD